MGTWRTHRSGTVVLAWIVFCGIYITSVSSQGQPPPPPTLTYDDELLKKVDNATKLKETVIKRYDSEEFYECFGDEGLNPKNLTGTPTPGRRGIVPSMTGDYRMDGKSDNTSIYFNLIQAYYFSVPALKEWEEANTAYEILQKQLYKEIRPFQRDLELVKKQLGHCTDLEKHVTQDFPTPTLNWHLEKAKKYADKCLAADSNIEKFLVKFKEDAKWEEAYLTACQASLDNGFRAFYLFTTFLWESDTISNKTAAEAFFIHFNKRRLSIFWDLSLFPRMITEYFRMHQEIHERLNDEYNDKLIAKNKDLKPILKGPESKIEEIRKKLTTKMLPDAKFPNAFEMVFVPNFPDGYKDPYFFNVEKCADEPASYTQTGGFWKDLCEMRNIDVNGEIVPLYIDQYAEYRKGWLDDHGNLRLDQIKKDLTASAFKDFLKTVVETYDKYFYAEPVTKADAALCEMVPPDPNNPAPWCAWLNKETGADMFETWKWNTDTSNPQDTKNFIHKMRLGWNLLGRILEELKCYQRETYYFHIRPGVLKSTQLNLTGKGALFTGISQTMFTPCEIVDDNDLVTRFCTKENHEICMPMAPLNNFRTDSLLEGFGPLRPKWIAWPELERGKETGKNCVARKDFVSTWYHCRCGFRLDCGDDLVPKEQLTCVLQPEGMWPGQCRGSIAYPCKTLPLAPGMHHESCVTGFCDMEENSCEDRPFVKQDVEDRASFRIVPPFYLILILCYALLFL